MSQFIVSSPVILQGHHRGEVRSVYYTLQAQLYMCGYIQPTAQQNLTDSSVGILQAQLHRHRSVYIILLSTAVHVWLYPADGTAISIMMPLITEKSVI